MPRRIAVLLALLVAALTPVPARAALFLHDGFNVRDGLLTDEYSYWNHLPSRDPRWQMTSGSLFARGGRGWTGHPDGCSSASRRGTPCNASDVFRLNTRAHRFGDVQVGFDLLNLRLTSSDRTPAEDWDGVHVWLHYQSEFEL
jgi:hypothetical protein